MTNLEAGPSSTDTSSAAEPFRAADQAHIFGPSFFLHHLGRFVRDHCPDPSEHLPLVQIRLADGVTLDVCHVIGVSPRWVLLAIRDAASPREDMAIEFVPYDLIRRIEIATRRSDGASIGFSQAHPPHVIAAEALLQSAMAPPEAIANT